MRWLILVVPLVVAVVIFAGVFRDLARLWRRRRARDQLDQNMRQREEAGLALPGGCAANPVEIETPALVEPVATAEKCWRCAGDLRLIEHTAERQGGERLRVAHLTCARCGAAREMFFRLPSAQLH